jgi:hypothetical protein
MLQIAGDESLTIATCSFQAGGSRERWGQGSEITSGIDGD